MYPLLFIASLHVAKPQPALAGEGRPYIFGCGIVWGNWLGLDFEEAKAWDRMQMDRIVEMGGTNCPANFAWIDIERQEGVVTWDYVDHQVAEANARGLEIFAYTGLTPDWALPPGVLAQHGSGSGYRFPPDPAYTTHFTNFFTALATRYAGQVKYYEFWNEPNGCSWMNDGCSNGHMAHTYVPWLIPWYDAMKARDPNCVLAVGGLDYNHTSGNQSNYIADIYANGGGDHFDAVAIHPYAPTGLNWQAITDTYNVLVNNGDGHKKLWINEYGWNTSDENFKAQQITNVLNTIKQPQYHMVFQLNHLIMTDLPQVPYTNHDYGLANGDLKAFTITPRASWYAFQAVDKTFPCVADFSADVTSGPAPLTVQFTDESDIPEATGWLWDFGDGTTSTDQHPSHVYLDEGRFTVTLTVQLPGDDESTVKTDYIWSVALPRVAFITGNASPSVADAGVRDHLQSLGYAVDVMDDEPANRPTAAQIASQYDLVLGSSTLLSANVAGEFRTFDIPFVYWESALSLTDRESLAEGPGIAGNQTAINVIDNTHPVLDGVPLGAVTVADTPAVISFSNAAPAPGIQTLATLAGDASHRTIMVAEPGAMLLDGGTAIARRIFLHFYDETWTRSNPTGKRILENALFYALDGNVPTPAFKASQHRGVAPLVVRFTDTSIGEATAWTWDVGDGTTFTTRHPAHTFTTPGTYDVTLTVELVGRSNVLTKTGHIVVDATPYPDYDNDGDIDIVDFGRFQVCLTGPNAGPVSAICRSMDLDLDDDVDLSDFGQLQACMSGANIASAPDCLTAP